MRNWSIKLKTSEGTFWYGPLGWNKDHSKRYKYYTRKDARKSALANNHELDRKAIVTENR